MPQSEPVPSAMELMMTMSTYMAQLGPLLMQASAANAGGQSREAHTLFAQLIDVNQEYARLALLYNRHYQPPFDIVPIIQPLISQLFTQADILDALGEPGQAEAHRAEAIALAEEHLNVSGQANVELTKATVFVAQARFNEALVALSLSQDLYEREGDVVKLANATVKQAEVLHWLGDFARALTALDRAERAIVGKTASYQQPGGDTPADQMLAGMQWMQQKVELDSIRYNVTFFRALTHKSLEQYDAAERLLRDILPTARQPMLNVGPAIEIQLAGIEIERGRHEDGLAYARRLEPEIAADGRMRPKLPVVWKMQAEALLGLGYPQDALPKLDAGIDALAASHDPDNLWKLQWMRGRALAALQSAGRSDGPGR